jgi:ATP-binding cassette subfamily B protein
MPAGTDQSDSGNSSNRSAGATLGRLMPFLRPYRGRILIAAGALLVAAAATLALPLAFRFLIDRGFNTTDAMSGALSDDVTLIFVGLFCLAVLLALTTAIRFYCVSWLGDRIVADLRTAVFSSVLRQDPVFFETLRAGEVLSRLSSDTTLIQSLVGSSISLGLRNVLLFIGGLILMIWSSPSLASLIVFLLVLVVAPILIIGRQVRRLSRDSQDRLADTSVRASETLGAMTTVQSYVQETLESTRYAGVVEHAFDSAVRRNRRRAILTALVISLVFGSIVFVLWLGAQAVADARMSPGVLTQFMLYAAIVAGSTGALSEVLGDVQRAAGATERLLELLDAKPAIVGGTIRLPDPSSQTSSGSTVAFDQVDFSYPSRPNEQALAGVSFEIKPGETLALVGPSGAGKTTVFQLLMRFHDPSSGRIFVDGHALPELTLDSLRATIGFVSQESVVFSDDVASNLRFGKPDASDDELIAAARAAQAHEFIERLPQGYATPLGEKGVRLSGGQRQRLSIARALLKNPPLLLLDEATSALDAEAERKVQLALDTAMTGRTTLVIAHRLATVVSADRILVLDGGRIVESGTHNELVAAGGLYSELAALQFESPTRKSPQD